MNLQPHREVGPPVRCARCKCLAECAIPFAGQSPELDGMPMIFSSKVCEDCYEVAQRSLSEFFDAFRN